MSELEVEGGGGRRCGVRSPTPASVRGGAIRRSPTPTRVVGEAVQENGSGLLPCGQGVVRVLPASSALVLEFLQGPFLKGRCCGCVRGAYFVYKPVRGELGLVRGHVQVMFYDQVDHDFSFALKLPRLGREALALIQRGLDLAADRHQYR